MNGNQGDDPLIDILTYALPVFAPEVDDLIREIQGLGGFESPMAIEYVRTMPELLAWPLQLPALSDDDRESIRRSYMDRFRETLARERDRLRK